MRSILKSLTLLMALLFCNAAMAAIDNKDVLNKVVDRYEAVASTWATTISGYASWLFWCLVTISLVWTFGLMALRKADIGEFFAEFIRFIMFTGFFYWLLANAATCGTAACPSGQGIGPSIINGVARIGAKAAGISDTVTPSSIVDIGFELFDKVSDNSSWWEPVDSVVGFILAGIILVVLALVAINMLLLLITGWVMMYAGIFFLGFGGARWTSDMALNYFKSVIGLGAQLMTMALLVGIGKSFLDEYYRDMQTGLHFQEMAVIMIIAITLLVLVNKVPGAVAGIMSGSSIGNSGIGNFGAGAAVGAASMAASALSTGSSVLKAGASGLMGGAASFAGGAHSLYSAFKGAQSNVSAGTDFASRMFGGGGSGGGGSSPLGGAMGLAATASGESGGGASASMGAAGAAGGSSEGGSAGMAQASDTGSAGGGGADGGQPAASGSGSDGKGGGSSSSKMGTAGRIALDMGANLASGVGRMAQARIDNTLGGKLAAQISQGGAGDAASSNTASSSRSFDPASEVAAYRDSKQEKA
ncbi:P-type conjugative transfer protein TrbL [Pseudomonas sp. NPDC089401]|uniref:P-type conjugative transfer protein TrbL n=1 Tax=Pseudomonas sp. NPDC089401 TaxID=3364462 RepID=UPI003822861A